MRYHLTTINFSKKKNRKVDKTKRLYILYWQGYVEKENSHQLLLGGINWFYYFRRSLAIWGDIKYAYILQLINPNPKSWNQTKPSLKKWVSKWWCVPIMENSTTDRSNKIVSCLTTYIYIYMLECQLYWIEGCKMSFLGISARVLPEEINI